MPSQRRPAGRARHLYVCPSCGRSSFRAFSWGVPGKFREYASLVDGKVYPSCRRVERLCDSCIVDRWGDEETRCMVLPRASATVNGLQSSTSRPLAAGPLAEFSELWAFLTLLTHPDGVSRLTGHLSLSLESGVLKLSLTCDESRQYACLMGSSLGDLLAEVELRLEDGSLPWRPSRYAKARK